MYKAITVILAKRVKDLSNIDISDKCAAEQRFPFNPEML